MKIDIDITSFYMDLITHLYPAGSAHLCEYKSSSGSWL